jgi:hypothetical protein
LLNNLIISFLAISLFASPVASGAAAKVKAGSPWGELNVSVVHADFVAGIAYQEECHHVADSKCCKDECGCCVTQFFPISAGIANTLSFSLPMNLFRPVGQPDPLADRLIRPPRYS